jgi:hypothetical protein
VQEYRGVEELPGGCWECEPLAPSAIRNSRNDRAGHAHICWEREPLVRYAIKNSRNKQWLQRHARIWDIIIYKVVEERVPPPSCAEKDARNATRKAVTTDRLASAPFTSLPAGLFQETPGASPIEAYRGVEERPGGCWEREPLVRYAIKNSRNRK